MFTIQEIFSSYEASPDQAPDQGQTSWSPNPWICALVQCQNCLAVYPGGVQNIAVFSHRPFSSLGRDSESSNPLVNNISPSLCSCSCRACTGLVSPFRHPLSLPPLVSLSSTSGHFWGLWTWCSLHSFSHTGLSSTP